MTSTTSSLAALALLLPAVASAQEPALIAEPQGWRDLGGSAVDAIRVGLSVDSTTRSFEVQGSAVPVQFDAPLYPGLALNVELRPLAWFAPASAWRGLAVSFTTGKHQVTTGVQVPADPEPIPLKIPTRHDETSIGISYELTLEGGTVLRPRAGLRSVEFALGGNPIYTSSFYQSLEAGLDVGWSAPSDRWGVEAGATLRPSVDMGSTSASFGSDPEISGWGVRAGLHWRPTSRWVVHAEGRMDRYSGSFALGDAAGGARAELTDRTTSFVVGLDWAY